MCYSEIRRQAFALYLPECGPKELSPSFTRWVFFGRWITIVHRAMLRELTKQVNAEVRQARDLVNICR